MFVVELRFALPSVKDQDAIVSGIQSLVSALERNGSLCGFLPPIVRTEEGCMVHSRAPAKDAFRSRNRNKWVRQEAARMKKLGVPWPKVSFLGEEVESEQICRCHAPSAYYLFTTFIASGPPIHCMDCFGAVPLYRIPRPDSGEHSSLLTWASQYRACDTLHMLSGAGEQFGYRQMSEIRTPLSKSGLSVANNISEAAGKPCYYFLHRFLNNSREEVEKKRKCPGCGGDWLLAKPLTPLLAFRCDRCHLVSTLNWDVQ